MDRKPTLADVQKLSGLSIYTVSRALNDADGVSAASRRKVLEAARKIGYVPNKAARALRTQSPGPVIVMTASTSNYYYIDMIDGIQAALRNANIALRFVDLAPEGRFDPKLEDEAVLEAMQTRATGLISTLTLSDTNYEKLAEWGVPVVFVDSQATQSERGTASVVTDNVDAASQLGDHLATHEIAEWVLLIYTPVWTTRRPREAGLREAARRANKHLTVLECGNDPSSASQVLRTFLNDRKRGKFALIAGNNPLLQGALTTLRDMQLVVPDDVAVLAFDEFPWASLLDPPVTVIDEDSRNIGELAANKLVNVIQRKTKLKNGEALHYLPEDTEVVTADLVIRRSCGCK